MEDNRNKAGQQPEQEGQGRTNIGTEQATRQTSNQEKGDISEVDQQEGDMSNGELGGNFGSLEDGSSQDRSESRT